MKTKEIFYVLVIMLISVIGTFDANAQGIATASANASVVSPISLVKNVDMNFGNASVSSSAGGSIVLAPAGTRSVGGSGVTLPATTGTVAAAGFTVAGAPGFTYAITLPGTIVINGPSATTMSVNSFTSVPSVTGTLNSGGTQYLTVGATLNIAAAQASGAYTNATALPVTINYN